MLQRIPYNVERVGYTGNRLGPISLVGRFLLNACNEIVNNSQQMALLYILIFAHWREENTVTTVVSLVFFPQYIMICDRCVL